MYCRQKRNNFAGNILKWALIKGEWEEELNIEVLQDMDTTLTAKELPNPRTFWTKDGAEISSNFFFNVCQST
jgi:hypothetical protein